MSHYSTSAQIACPPDMLFDFVSNPENMPKYLPTLHEAHSSGAETVSMDGEAEGHPYHADGDLHIDRSNRKMNWGSESNHKYRGELAITGEGNDSRISIELDFQPGQKTEDKIKEEHPDGEAKIQEALEQSIASIKQICER